MADDEAAVLAKVLLRARPGPVRAPAPAGLQPLGLAEGRDGLLYVPRSYDPEAPAPLVVMLHGAGGGASRTIAPLTALAEARGLILLAPDSRGRTWDVVLGGYGPDVAFIDRALAHVFERYTVSPERLALAGFSDGASYALSIGIMNGALFSHIIAFSPGFSVPVVQQGEPAIFISHGTADKVLPIERCGRRLRRILAEGGYHVSYHEFDGPHTVPPAIAAGAVAWLLDSSDVVS
jgi:phospholipase/carboxylesterase